jgi:hypothetical protein
VGLCWMAVPHPSLVSCQSGEGVDVVIYGVSGYRSGAVRTRWVMGVAACCLYLWFSMPTASAGEGTNVSKNCANVSLVGFRDGLPDCRAYEMVSPPYKEDEPIGGLYAVSSDGTSVIEASKGVFAGAENDLANGLFGGFYKFTRGDTGWVSQALDPPANYTKAILEDASSNLARSLWVFHASSWQENLEEYYMRESDGTFRQVGPASAGVTVGMEKPVIPFQEPVYLGASVDLSHIVFYVRSSSNYNLWPGDTTVTTSVTQSLYEYSGLENREPRLVGVSNNGRLEGRVYVNEDAKLIGTCGTVLGGRNESTGEASMYNALSHDGAVIFFTTLGQNECTVAGSAPPVGEVYARVDGEKTVDISEPVLPLGEECTVGHVCFGAAPEEGIFQGASQDGSKVFFLTEQPLLNSDTDAMMDLYEAEIEGTGLNAKVGNLVMVSAGGVSAGMPGAEKAEVQGVARISEDGSHVYFVAKGLLTTSGNSEGEVAQVGADNFYVYDTQTEQISFVARLSESSDRSIWAGDEGPVEATPDGRFLVFKSGAQLTRDDRSGPQAPQIFEYDAQNGALTRVSIGQKGNYLCPFTQKMEGYNCDGNTNSEADRPSINFPGYERNDKAITAASTLTVSNDGSMVVFASLDSLVPLAVSGVRNVYEYHDGNVYLISDGQGSSAPGSSGEPAGQLLSIDGAGEDVFFASADPLLPQSGDTSLGLYDAREFGGFPATTDMTNACLSDGCRGPLSAAPDAPVGASASVGAEGNLALPVVKSKPVKRKVKARKRKGKAKGAGKGKVKARKAKARKTGAGWIGQAGSGERGR